VVSVLLLALQDRFGQQPFELVIVGLLLIIAIGFLTGLFISPPDAGAVVGGLVPRFDGVGSIVLAASMLGATVMPHAIYVHSALARDRHGVDLGDRTARLLRVTKVDVSIALGIAGIVNIGMLLLAAVNLQGLPAGDVISQAHTAIEQLLGPLVALVFAIGLLASGLASTSVGSYAGATIMAGLLHRRIPMIVRRVVTLIPALVVLVLGANPTAALVISQVVLSFGIPFALIPLVRLTRDRSVVGAFANGRGMHAVLIAAVVLVVALNVTLVVLAIAGAA
jgi:manganese transport protein